jgi:hypothetical protein
MYHFCSFYLHSDAPHMNSFLCFTFRTYSIFTRTKTFINIRLKSSGESGMVFEKEISACIK